MAHLKEDKIYLFKYYKFKYKLGHDESELLYENILSKTIF
jgi:hypothetical protein